MQRLKHNQTKYILLLLLGVFLFGCSPKMDYKVLSFFFDGVTDPSRIDTLDNRDAAQAADSLQTTAATQRKTPPPLVYHAPYQEKKCGSCHNKNVMGTLTKLQPALCLDCHEGMLDSLNFIHGPVGAGYCTDCHNPHLSELRHLLTRPGQSLCISCHDAALVSKNENHSSVGDAECIQCHNPHGGNNRYMLN